MVTGLGNYQPIEAEDLLAQLSDADKETDDLDDSFNILEVGMDTGELDEVSFICESIYNGNNGSNGDEDNWLVAGSSRHFNVSLPEPFTAPVDFVGLSEDSDSSNDNSGNSSDFSDSSTGEEETRAKRARKPAKKWKKGSKSILKAIKVFDNSNVFIKVPYNLPVDAKEVEYLKL